MKNESVSLGRVAHSRNGSGRTQREWTPTYVVFNDSIFGDKDHFILHRTFCPDNAAIFRPSSAILFSSLELGKN